MTDLQTSLMAIGGTIVAGVIVFNKWQEYKAKKSVEKAFSSEHDDVLMAPDAPSAAPVPPSPVSGVPGADQRFEPTLGDELVIPAADPANPHAAQPVAQSDDAPDAAMPHAVDEMESLVVAPPEAKKKTQKELPVDDLIDCLIPISLAAPMRGEKILPRLQSLRHVGNKPIHFIGQRDDGEWETVMHGGIYHAVTAAVQLANRSSALNEIEYSELIMSLRQICDEIEGEPDVPDMARIIERARALHQFVAEYDAQLSVNVQSNGGPWPIHTLLTALERQGFDIRPDGRLVMPDGEGGVLFSLSTNVTLAEETTSRLTLLLDVPRVDPALDGFGAMVACSRVLAARLEGTVVDDGNQPLSYAAVEEIAGQVTSFYMQMNAAEIPAGSSRALRLFS